MLARNGIESRNVRPSCLDITKFLQNIINTDKNKMEME
jgi:hypothetical protein